MTTFWTTTVKTVPTSFGSGFPHLEPTLEKASMTNYNPTLKIILESGTSFFLPLVTFSQQNTSTSARKHIFFLSNIEEYERLLRFLQLGLEGGDVSGKVPGVTSRGKLSQCVVVNLWFDSRKMGYRLPLLFSTYRTAATRLTLNQPVTCNAAGWWILHTAFQEVT